MIYQFYQRRVFPHLLNQVMQTASLMDKRRELLLPIEGEVLEIGYRAEDADGTCTKTQF